jgi:hypothetical protein
MEREVKRERTGRRDLALNDRHRLWGWNVPAVDIDLFLEYDHGQPRGLVEYKAASAALVDPDRDRNSQALVAAANLMRIPALAVRYARDFTWWVVTPLNNPARRWISAEHQEMTEADFVRLLYRIRGYYGLPAKLAFDESTGVLVRDAQGRLVTGRRVE